MNKTVNTVFVVLGVLFVIVLLIGAGFYLSLSYSGAAPSYSKQPVNTDVSGTSAIAEGTIEGSTDGTSFTLTTAQKQALSSFGIDPASVPSTISGEQEACFVAELGSARVNEIKAGDTPSAIDFFKAKGCI